MDKDFETAAEYYRIGVEHGLPYSECSLADFHLRKLINGASPERGIELLTMAAEHGDREARKKLSTIYSQGLYGVPADDEKAAMWSDSNG